MKVAILPDGRQVQFPADMHDAEVDNAVRQMMGVKSEADLASDEMEAQTSAQMLETANGIAQIISQLVQVSQQNQAAISELTGVIAQLGGQVASALAANAQQTDKLGRLVVQASKNVADAYTAPKSLVKSPDGKTATLQVEQNTNRFIGG